MNKSILMGRLTADPELKSTQSGISVTSFTLAVNRPKQKDKEQIADFIEIVAWRSTAEFISKYFVKGQQMALVGTIRTRTYEDKEGKKRKVTEVVADEVFFADSKKNTANNTETAPYNSSTFDNDFEEIDTGDEDLPF